MVEPIPYTKDRGRLGQLWDDDPTQLVKAVGGAPRPRRLVGLHVAEDPGDGRRRRMLSVTTQPLLILGGAPGPDPEATFASWEPTP